MFRFNKLIYLIWMLCSVVFETCIILLNNDCIDLHFVTIPK